MSGAMTITAKIAQICGGGGVTRLVAGFRAGSGAATLKVVGDLSGLSENVSIPLGACADGASEAAITVDATELMLPSAQWRTRLKARDGVFALDVKKSVGMTLIVR